MLDLFKASLEMAPIINVGGYDYFIHPITDGIPRLDPRMLDEVAGAMLEAGRFDCDVILAPEAMGIPIAVPLSLRTGVPYAIVRKRRYGLPEEVEVDQATGYSRCAMFLNGLRQGDRVVIVDDILSTGGTLRCIVAVLQRMGVRIVDIIAVLEKGDARPKLERELGVRIKTLLRIEIRDAKVIVSDPLPRDE